MGLNSRPKAGETAFLTPPVPAGGEGECDSLKRQPDPNEMISIPERLNELLFEAEPVLRDIYGDLLARKNKPEEKDWPDWCYLPTSSTVELVRWMFKDRDEVDIEDVISEAPKMAAVSAWRPCRAVIDLSDKKRQEKIMKQEIPTDPGPRDLDMGVWCPFVFLGADETGSKHGAFLHLDEKDDRPVLHGLGVDENLDSRPFPVELQQGSLKAGARKVLEETLKGRRPGEPMGIELGTTDQMVEDFEPILKMAYYIAETEWTPRLPEAPRRTIEMPHATTVYQEAE